MFFDQISLPDKEHKWLRIAWYACFTISLVYGIGSTTIFGFGVWFLATDFQYFRDYAPVLIESNYFLIYDAICGVTVIAVMGTATTLTYLWSLFTRHGSLATTIFYYSLIPFAEGQIVSGVVLGMSVRPALLVIENAMLVEAAANFTTSNDDRGVLKIANKWFGCCGIYNLNKSCDQNYPSAANSTAACLMGSTACQTGCLDVVKDKIYFSHYNAGWVTIVFLLTFFSTIAMVWRFWSHKETRKHISHALNANYVVAGALLVIIGLGGLIHDFVVLRQYMPSYVTANKVHLKVVYAMMTINGLSRVPHIVLQYVEQALQRGKWIARFLLFFLFIVQLGSAFCLPIYYSLELGYPGLARALEYESSANITDGLLRFANRRSDCCGIYDIDGDRCDKSYPPVDRCAAGMPTCAKGCINNVWKGTVMSEMFNMSLGFFAFNVVSVFFVSAGMVGAWIYQASETCRNSVDPLSKWIKLRLSRRNGNIVKSVELNRRQQPVNNTQNKNLNRV